MEREGIVHILTSALLSFIRPSCDLVWCGSLLIFVAGIGPSVVSIAICFGFPLPFLSLTPKSSSLSLSLSLSVPVPAFAYLGLGT